MIDMLTFSDIKEADANALALLDSECFSVPWSCESFLNEAKNPLAQYVIARLDDKIIGYAGYWQVLDEAQITNVAVIKDYRRQKIGHQLIKKLITKAKANGIINMTLEVRKSNIPAISLYSSFGFSEVGTRKNYYKNPTEDAVLMDLKIN